MRYRANWVRWTTAFALSVCISTVAAIQGWAAQTELQKLTAGGTEEDTRFGECVALDGDWAAVGAPRDSELTNRAGAVFVFKRVNGSFVPWQTLTAPDGNAKDGFGTRIALDGHTMAIASAIFGYDRGDIGSVYIFTLRNDGWSMQSKLTPSDGEAGDSFGASLSLSGDTLAVGAYKASALDFSDGKVYLFQRSGDSWQKIRQFIAPVSLGFRTELGFGYALCIDGDTLVVGAPSFLTFQGHAYVFHRQDETWAYQSELMPETTRTPQLLGVAVAVSADRIAVCGDFAPDFRPPSDPGVVVYTFQRVGENWMAQTRLLPGYPDLVFNSPDRYGHTLALSPRMLVVGTHDLRYSDTKTGASAYVYAETEVDWVYQTQLNASNHALGSGFSNALAVSGNELLVGAPRVDSAYLYAIEGLPAPTPGDVNGDKRIDATDVQLLINAVLGIGPPQEFADVTGDGAVNAADIQAGINLLLGLS